MSLVDESAMPSDFRDVLAARLGEYYTSASPVPGMPPMHWGGAKFVFDVIRASGLVIVTTEQAALGLAWERVETALPAGWRPVVQRTEDDYDVWAATAVSPAFFEGENEGDYCLGDGPTLIVALSALADTLEARK